MRVRSIGSLGALPPGAIQEMISGIDKISDFLFRIKEVDRDRSIVADDIVIEGEKLSLEAEAFIRSDVFDSFPVGANQVAIDGRRIREFLPVWERIVSELGLTGEAKINPVAELTGRDVFDSLARLKGAKTALTARLKGKSKGRSMWPLLLGVAAFGVFLKK